MRLLSLHIDGFGKFHDQTVSFEDGLNVIYGKNEAGKSTLHTFIRGMLFGIERQRGRASKNGIYGKYEPWDKSWVYGGWLRLESGDQVYRIERCFSKERRSFTIVNETLGQEMEPSKALMDQLLCGLSETAYNNTISIGQLKCATDAGMVSELKNYITNLNTSGNISLNITKASAFLKDQRRCLEARMVPEAAKSYAAVLSEIRNVEQEIALPQYENQLPAYRDMRTQVGSQLEEKQQEKEDLLQKAARGRQLLSSNQFETKESILSYQAETKRTYEGYRKLKESCDRHSGKAFTVVLFLAAALCAAGAAAQYLTAFLPVSKLTGAAGLAGACVLCLIGAVTRMLRAQRYKRELAYGTKLLQEIFSRHIGDSSISDEAFQAFNNRMEEFSRLSDAVDRSEETIGKVTEDISKLQQQQSSFSSAIEEQQKLQWELEQKLEYLADSKTKAESLKHTINENERISQELAAIDLAQETLSNLASSIRSSFGLYLNKTASELISGITGGIYNSMSIDENLNVFMNTRTKLVPISQVSSGTMDQIYLAVRLAAASLIQTGPEKMPLIFDDSFTLYDDDRLKTALKWLTRAFLGQIIIFTCHQREAQLLTANQIPYHIISI